MKNNVMLVLRSGGDYTFRDVELLSHHLYKHNNNIQIYCLWDRIEYEINLGGVIMLPMKYHWKGWWSKLNLFSPELEKYRPFLFMDLDTAIVGEIDDITQPKYPEAFITLGSFVLDVLVAKNLFSGVMWIPKNNNKIKQIWEEWLLHPEKHMINLRGDQDFLKYVVLKPDYYWQQITEKICSFKPKNGRAISNKMGKIETIMDIIPIEKKLICFHGYPRIYQALEHGVKWVESYYYDCFSHFIKEAWVINLDERKDRYERFKKQPIPFIVQRFPAIKNADGELGCKLSHLAVLKKAHKFPFVVFEDDCRFINDWEVFNKAVQQLPEDWDMLFLGANVKGQIKKYSLNLYELKNAVAAHAIIYNTQKVVDFIIEHQNDYKQLDTLNRFVVEEQFKCFLVNPMMALQEPGKSDIQKAHRDYDNEILSNFEKFAK